MKWKRWRSTICRFWGKKWVEGDRCLDSTGIRNCVNSSNLKSAFKKLCCEIATYISASLSSLSAENLLEMKLNPVFSGIQEAIDLRNYLLTFVKNPNKKKMYQEGFIYIMSI